MKYIYRVYQIFIALPIVIFLTILTSVVTSIGCTLGNGHFWGYYPPVIWSTLVLKVLLLPVEVKGRENLKHGESYVFVSNHQGSFDIFLIFGHLRRNFKWMMKRQLRKIPFVGFACEKSHQIFVDKRGPSKVKETYDKARTYPLSPSRLFTPHLSSSRISVMTMALTAGAKCVFPCASE